MTFKLIKTKKLLYLLGSAGVRPSRTPLIDVPIVSFSSDSDKRNLINQISYESLIQDMIIGYWITRNKNACLMINFYKFSFEFSLFYDPKKINLKLPFGRKLCVSPKRLHVPLLEYILWEHCECLQFYHTQQTKNILVTCRSSESQPSIWMRTETKKKNLHFAYREILFVQMFVGEKYIFLFTNVLFCLK